jgi:hypothetical protein
MGSNNSANERAGCNTLASSTGGAADAGELPRRARAEAPLSRLIKVLSKCASSPDCESGYITRMQGKEFRRKVAPDPALFQGEIVWGAPDGPGYSRATRADTGGGASFSSAKRWR